MKISARELEIEWWEKHRKLVFYAALIAFAICLSYVPLDAVIAPQKATAIYFLRALAAGLMLLYAAASRRPSFARRAGVLTSLLVAASGLLVPTIYLGVLGNVMLGVIATLQLCMVVFVVAAMRLVVRVTAATMILGMNAGLAAMHAGRSDWIVANSVIASAALLLVVVSELSYRAYCHTRELEAQLTHASSIDFLTGLNNRRAFFASAHGIWNALARNGRPACVMLVDIDHFKSVNDTHGHDTGDRLLQAVAATVEEQLRGYDVSCRYGGEEFAVLLPETDLAGALLVAERLRSAVTALRIQTRGEPVTCTLSVGVAPAQPAAQLLEKSLEEADIALYHAKRWGRNRCSAYSAGLASLATTPAAPSAVAAV